MAVIIRELLVQAQEAELGKDYPKAVRLLRDAEAYYRDRQLDGRADQMARNAARIAKDHSVPVGDGFGDELLDVPPPQDDTMPGGQALTPQERAPVLADAQLDAWCSFCCKPKTEVGAMVAGPAGAFICRGCVTASAALHGGVAATSDATLGEVPPPITDVSQRQVKTSQEAPVEAVRAAGDELPAQQRARIVWTRRRPKLALVVGPAGAGKSHLAARLGPVVEVGSALPDGDVAVVELNEPVSDEVAGRIIAWSEARQRRAVVLVCRAALPVSALALRGEHGEATLHTTAELSAAVGAQVPLHLLERVELVLELPAPAREDLMTLGVKLLAQRFVQADARVVEALVDAALKSGRALHEVLALVRRVPPGRYA